jgi:broad specificity phosphatase PhoE
MAQRKPGNSDGWVLFVRHSESCANQLKAAYKDKKGLQKLRLGMEKIGYNDPELTELGESWATLRGEQLAPYVSQTTKMFASTLFRTQLTAMFILEGIKKTKTNYNPTITVLPNSSEVSGFSYFEKDNAPLNSANFVSFDERRREYYSHKGPRFEEKIKHITGKAGQFDASEAQSKRGASSSTVSELLKWLHAKQFLISNSRNVSTPVKISGLSAIPIKDGPKYHPNEVTVDHLDAVIVSHGGVMKAIIESLGGKKPEIGNLDSILFRIKYGKISAAYLMPMPNRESALKLGFPETDKSCLRNECQSQSHGGFLRKRTRRQRDSKTRTRRHRRRGQEQL